LAHKETSIDLGGLEIVCNDAYDHMRIKLLAAKHVQIHIVGLLHEVRTDIRRLNQLDERIPLLVARAEHDNLRRAVCDHINLLDKIGGELIDIGRATNEVRGTTSNVNNEMGSPHSF